LARRDWRRRGRRVSQRSDSQIPLDLNEAARRGIEFARGEWDRAVVTDKYEDADYYVIKGVSPSGEWTVMFDKRSGRRVVPP